MWRTFVTYLGVTVFVVHVGDFISAGYLSSENSTSVTLSGSLDFPASNPSLLVTYLSVEARKALVSSSKTGLSSRET